MSGICGIKHQVEKRKVLEIINCDQKQTGSSYTVGFGVSVHEIYTQRKGHHLVFEDSHN